MLVVAFQKRKASIGKSADILGKSMIAFPKGRRSEMPHSFVVLPDL